MSEPLRFVFVSYSLPVAQAIDSPAWALRACGLGLGRAGWVVPRDRLNDAGLQKLATAGGDVHMLLLDLSEGPLIVDRARKEMLASLQWVSDEIRAFERAMTEQLPGAATAAEVKRVRDRAYRVITKARRTHDAVAACCAGFGLATDFEDVLARVRALVRERGEQWAQNLDEASVALSGHRKAIGESRKRGAA